MECPNCRRDNEPGRRFCIYCGSPLLSLDLQMHSIEEEVRKLTSLVSLISERLTALERMQGITAPPARPAAPLAGTGVTETAPATEPAPAASVIADQRAAPTVEQWESPLVGPLPSRPPEAPPRPPREWEQILGGNWLARIGVVLLIIGVGFFLKFAFDQNWLAPPARVILGIVAGTGMLAGGYYWRNRYPTLSQAISGGGVALLYLSIFAAFAFFRMLHPYLAIALLFVVSGGSAMIAMRQDSMALAVIGILGAFIAPFLLGAFGPGGTEAATAGTGFQLLIYIMIVDLGVIALSTFRNWRWFTRLALIGSLASFGVWYDAFGNRASLFLAEGSLTVLFLIFVGATTLYHIVWRRAPQPLDYALMVTNAVAYFGISYGLMWVVLREWMGGFTLLLALFYGVLAYVAFRRDTGNSRLSFFALGIALVFLAVAIPVQLGDRAWTTVAWAAEGAVLVWLGTRFRMPQFRYYGYATFAVTAIRLFFFDTPVALRTFQPVVNERVLAFVFAIVAMYLAGYLLWRHNESAPGSKELQYAFPAFAIAGNFFSLWLVGAEIISYRVSPVVYEGSLCLALLIIFAGAMTFHHLVWRRPSVAFDLVLMPVNAAFYLGISIPLWGDFRAWMGGLYLLLALFYGTLYYATSRVRSRSDGFGLLALGIALVFVTLAVPVQFGDQAWTTIAWSIELVALAWLYLRLGMPLFGVSGCVVFAALGVRLLFFDTSVDMGAFRPILNERFLAFVVSITAMYLVAYLLWRGREGLRERITALSVSLVAANFFTLWLLGFEVWNYFDSWLAVTRVPAVRDTLVSAQNLSLTALVAFYAAALLVTGMVKRWRAVRLWALGLLIVPIGKVFVWDVWALGMVYRIVAFVGLGLLLIAGAYLYQRYGKAIRSFIAEKQ